MPYGYDVANPPEDIEPGPPDPRETSQQPTPAWGNGVDGWGTVNPGATQPDTTPSPPLLPVADHIDALKAVGHSAAAVPFASGWNDAGEDAVAIEIRTAETGSLDPFALDEPGPAQPYPLDQTIAASGIGAQNDTSPASSK